MRKMRESEVVVMGCEICEPVLKEGRSTFEAGHVDYEKNVFWGTFGRYSISIYPKPYKAHKFYKLIGIKFCPYCGEDLKSKKTWEPKIIEELEE